MLKCGRSPKNWTLHTNITVAGTAILLIVGFLVIFVADRPA